MIKVNRGLSVWQDTRASSHKLSASYEKDTTICGFEANPGQTSSKTTKTHNLLTRHCTAKTVWICCVNLNGRE